MAGETGQATVVTLPDLDNFLDDSDSDPDEDVLEEDYLGDVPKEGNPDLDYVPEEGNLVVLFNPIVANQIAQVTHEASVCNAGVGNLDLVHITKSSREILWRAGLLSLYDNTLIVAVIALTKCKCDDKGKEKVSSSKEKKKKKKEEEEEEEEEEGLFPCRVILLLLLHFILLLLLCRSLQHQVGCIATADGNQLLSSSSSSSSLP